MEKYVNKNTIVKNEIYEMFKDNIICPICSNLMIEPVVCTGCQETFCKNCYKEGKTCAKKCEKSDIKDVIGKNNFITKFKFKCIKGCGETFLFDNIKNHYNSDCLSKKKKAKALSSKEAAKYKEQSGNDIPQIKIITLGLWDVGKTSLINTFIKGESSLAYMSTHGFDIVAKSFILSDGSIINTQIFDTSGQEKYKSINESYYKKADAILLVYDITNKTSFDEIKNYYCPKINELCKKNIPIILLGNKTDKKEKREVEEEEGIKLSISNNYKFKETSCKNNENVADAFEALIELWSSENMKKRYITRSRKNSGEFESNPHRAFVRSNTVVSIKKKQKIEPLIDNKKNKKFQLKDNKKERTKKKDSCC